MFTLLLSQVQRAARGLVVGGGLSVGILAAPPAEFGRVDLLRDRWGTPHVFAATDAGALYGLGYATAEDRL